MFFPAKLHVKILILHSNYCQIMHIPNYLQCIFAAKKIMIPEENKEVIETEETVNPDAESATPTAGQEPATAPGGTDGTGGTGGTDVIPDPQPASEAPKVDNLLEAVKSVFPDYDLSDENLNGWIVGALESYKNADMRINESLEANPEFAEILKKIWEGEDAISAMASVISPEEYAEMVENGGSRTKEARDGRVKHLKEIREWEQSRTDNIGISEQTVRQFQSETGKSDEEMMHILDTMNEINVALNDGKITKRELSLIDKLLNADANAQTAAQAASVQARNQNIEAKKATDFRPGGDGLPSLNPSGTPGNKANPLEGSLFGGERKSVWG
jgi:hypothetical protein